MKNNLITREAKVYKLKFDVVSTTIPNLMDVKIDFSYLELACEYEDDSIVISKEKLHDYELIKTSSGFSVILYLLEDEDNSINTAIDEDFVPILESSKFDILLGTNKYKYTWDDSIGCILQRNAPIQVTKEENAIINTFYKVFNDNTAVNYIYSEILRNKEHLTPEELQSLSAIALA